MTGKRFGKAVAMCLVGAGLAHASAALADAPPPPPPLPQTPQDLSTMSLSDLGNIDVTSVSKSSQPLSEAPASIYVITHDDIVRSGLTTIPEILRLAPNLQVYQQTASHFAVVARGFNGNSNAQSFPNKLLVLIDGRSVYSPLFSGVYWDMQDVLPEDIDRIEVISGPGATLWGANAVNGVINIITRKAGETQGALVDVAAGAREQTASLRYGGRIGASASYRLYARAINVDQSLTPAGTPAHDDFHRFQGGFRVDWAPSTRDDVMISGDAYSGTNAQLAAPNEDIAGRNITARWTHDTGGGSLQVQGFYDRTERFTREGGGHSMVDTYDLDLQDSISLGAGNALVWGGGLRASHYRVVGSGALTADPPRRTLLLGNIFAQDTLSLTSRLDLIAGLKVESDPYVGASLLPDLRLAWRPSEKTLLWGAVSRAVRSPTPFDEDVREFLGGQLFVRGNPDFRTEKLTAYELGGRFHPSPVLSFSISAYYNVYDDLRTVEPTPGTLLPLIWGNNLEGHSYGFDAWGSYRPARWWTLSAGFSVLRKHFRFEPGASQLLGVQQIGDDPPQQGTLKSSMDFGHGVTFDADFREVGPLPDPHVPGYAELDARLGWALSPHLELSVAGTNLLHENHLEYAGGYLVSRQVLAEVKWRF